MIKIKYGYVRVSSKEQHTERQVEALKNYGVSEENIYIDKVSGKTDQRESYQTLKKILLNVVRVIDKGSGDTVELYIKELDRLGRTSKIVHDELQWLNEQGIIVKIIEIPTTLIELDNSNDWVLKMVNNILIEVYQSLAEQELVKKEMRQREGIEQAKRRNVYKGRQPIKIDNDKFSKVVESWRCGNITALVAMEQLNLKPNTFYRRVKTYEQSKNR